MNGARVPATWYINILTDAISLLVRQYRSYSGNRESVRILLLLHNCPKNIYHTTSPPLLILRTRENPFTSKENETV